MTVQINLIAAMVFEIFDKHHLVDNFIFPFGIQINLGMGLGGLVILRRPSAELVLSFMMIALIIVLFEQIICN